MRGSDIAQVKEPGSMACSLSFSVFTKNVFFKWKTTKGTNLKISAAMPDQPSTITYVMKKVAFIGIDTPTVCGILHSSKTCNIYIFLNIYSITQIVLFWEMQISNCRDGKKKKKIGSYMVGDWFKNPWSCWRAVPVMMLPRNTFTSKNK